MYNETQNQETNKNIRKMHFLVKHTQLIKHCNFKDFYDDCLKVNIGRPSQILTTPMTPFLK